MLRNSVLNDSCENLISERRKLEQEKDSYRQENKRLAQELDQSRRDLQTAQRTASLKETALKQQSEFLRKEVKSKDKLIEQKTSEASKLRRDLAALESQITAASTSSTASSATSQQKQPDSEFFLDVLANLKESIENQFTCSICTEVFINSTTLHCGHTYCTDCLEEWERQNATCPVCRADIKCKHPTKILDGYIDKFISQYYSEEAKAARTALKEDRVKQVEKRNQEARLRTLDDDFFSVRMIRVNQLLRRRPLLSHLGRVNRLLNGPTEDDNDDDDEEGTPARSSTPRTSTSSASSVQSFTIDDINEIFRTPVRVPRRNIYESDDENVIAMEASDESNNTLNISFQYDDYQPAPDSNDNDEPNVASESANDSDEPDAPSESASSDHAGNSTDHNEEEDEDDFDDYSFGHLSASISRLSSTFSHSSDGAVFSSSSSDSDDED